MGYAKNIKKVGSIGAVCWVAACGSAEFVEPDVIGQPLSRSDYSNLYGKSFDVRLFRHERTSTGGRSLTVTDETVTLQASTTSDVFEVADITIDGQTLSFDPASDTAVLDGRLYHVYTTASGEYAALVGFQSDEAYRGFSNVDGMAVAGYLTTPTNLPTSGQAAYTGSFEIAGAGTRNTRFFAEFVLTGDVTLSVNFDDTMLEGTIDNGEATLLSTSGRYYDTFQGRFIPTPFENGQFETGITLDCSDDVICDLSKTSVHGGFYGPEGEEIAGTIYFDETLTEKYGSQDVLNYTGVGGFLVTKD